MVRKYKKKTEGGRKSYASSKAMEDAYNAVMGHQMTTYQAAKHFEVDKKSLLRRVRNEIPINAHVGRTTVLSNAAENELEHCLLVLSEWGWGFGKEEVKDIVKEYVVANDIQTPFKENRPSKDWFSNFLDRHPNVVPRKTEHLSNSRAKAEDPEVIQKWFELLDETLTKAGVKGRPDQIFNCDETGFVTDPKSQIVLARKGARRVNQSIGGSGREQITVNCAISASGQVLPPYVVYKGKNLYSDWTQGGPIGAAYTTSEKGWMEGPQFYNWFQTIFSKNTEHLASRPRVLIFDGHASHITKPLVEAALANNVILLRLPAHLTHLLQPLDTSVFRPVKTKWQALLLKYARTHAGPVSKKTFPSLLKSLYSSSFTAEQAKGGFRGTGIFPFNKEAIDTTLFQQRPQLASATIPSSESPQRDSTSSESPQLASTSSESPQLASTSSESPQLASTSTPSSPEPHTSNPPPLDTLSVDASSPNSVSSPVTAPSLLVPAPQRAPLLPSLQSELSPSIPSSSARVMRFRYGESLTGEECLRRLREDEAKKTLKGKGKGKKRQREQESDESNSNGEGVCFKCGVYEGDDQWVCCDICDKWFHVKCTDIDTDTGIETIEWVCDFCHRPL